MWWLHMDDDHMVLCFGFTFSLIIILLEKYHVLSVLLFICIWHLIVWVYKSDLLTRLQSLSPNYFYITQTLEYHTISWEIKNNRFWYKSFQILNDSLVYCFFGNLRNLSSMSSCRSSSFLRSLSSNLRRNSYALLEFL